MLVTKKALLAITTIFLVLVSTLVLAATDVGGLIDTDTTWALAGSPFTLSTSVLVADGTTLTIAAGSVIKITGDVGFQINGTLIARGTSTSPIVFEPASGTTAGSWGSVNFSDSSVDAVLDANEDYTSGSVMEYCQLKFGGGGGSLGT
ncbi:MAG: hypothetical protein QGH37_25150, partial [Candidatus Poribacteria bacterium]|nr:hypothetical protein [Candidatus Poribacteria bacterium]